MVAAAKLGIIAGSGELPEQVITACQTLKRDIYVVAIETITSQHIVTNAPHIWLHIGQIGKAIKTLKKEGVEELLMVGRVGRPKISALKLDISGLKLLSRLSKLKKQGDDEVFTTIISFFEKAGFKVVGIENVLHELLMPAGTLGTVRPDDIGWNDIRMGAHIAHTVGKLDIGQAVIVQHGLVLGVEGAEGTDKLIERCKDLHTEGSGGVLVKMKKPHQDTRVDLPSIGIKTIENAHRSGLHGIALEAGSALIINRDKVVAKANELGLFIVGINPPETARS